MTARQSLNNTPGSVKKLASVRVALLIQTERNLVAIIHTNLSVVIKAVPATSPWKILTHTVFILLLATCTHRVSENDWGKSLPDITMGILYHESAVSDDTFNVHLRSLLHRGKLLNVSLQRFYLRRKRFEVRLKNLYAFSVVSDFIVAL